MRRIGILFGVAAFLVTAGVGDRKSVV